MRGLLIRSLLAVALAAGAFILLPVGAATDTPPSGRYALAVDLGTTESGEGLLCRIRITDVETSKVLFAPELRARVGHVTSAVTRFSSGGVDCELRVSVERDESAVRYRFEAVHGGTVVSIQEADLEASLVGVEEGA